MKTVFILRGERFMFLSPLLLFVLVSALLSAFWSHVSEKRELVFVPHVARVPYVYYSSLCVKGWLRLV